jgi:hypothetical protein
MTNLFWLTDAQMARLEPFLPESVRVLRRSRTEGGRVPPSKVKTYRLAIRPCRNARSLRATTDKTGLTESPGSLYDTDVMTPMSSPGSLWMKGPDNAYRQLGGCGGNHL